jgi:hypothetical protein
MSGNHPRECKKRSRLIIGANDKPLSIAAMRACNPDRATARIHG